MNSGFELLKPKVAKQFKRNMKRVIKQLALSKQVLTVHLCDDKEIKALNKQFRGKNKATDVLSFEAGEGAFAIPVLGDIVISIETARRQAKAASHGLLEELTVLFVHGILHLLGYDHEKSDAEAVKHAEAEMFLLSMLNVPVEIALVVR